MQFPPGYVVVETEGINGVCRASAVSAAAEFVSLAAFHWYSGYPGVPVAAIAAKLRREPAAPSPRDIRGNTDMAEIAAPFERR